MMAFRLPRHSEAFSRQPTGKASKRVEKPRRAWADRLWEDRPGTIEKVCEGCARVMHLPPSKISRRFCTSECRSTDVLNRLTKQCVTCGETFVAGYLRQRACSQKCNPVVLTLVSPENLAKAAAGKRRAVEEGRVVFKSGPDNAQWKGGPVALRRRQIESGKTAVWVRRYRKENPDKVREFRQRRKARTLEKLPEGTVASLHDAQKGKCAICRAVLKKKWHLDHVTPLAKGGEHAPKNLQLLCAPCNLRKSDRDPIDHMRSLGRLL